MRKTDNMQELKEMPIWVCWDRKEKNGRTTKVPCAATGGATGTDEKYRKTWVSYADAVSAAERDGHAGVGFVIPVGWFFLDLDHVGLDDPWTLERLDRFHSYTELSQSGNGIHIYGKCDLERLPVREVSGKLKIDDRRYYIKHPTNGMELYIGGLTNRFAVFTGNAVRDVPLAECTDAVLKTFETDMRRGNGYRFTEPESVEQARRDYQSENSSVVSFFEECMTVRPHPKIEDNCTTGRVYDVYKLWCADNCNGYAKTAKEFREKLAEHLEASVEDIIIHTKRGNFYRDYTLKLDAKTQYSRAYGYDSVSDPDG